MREIAPRRFRAQIGLYYDDFEVGDVYEHRPGRTITDADNTQFSLLTMNYHPLHCDAHFASQTEFGKMLVNSGLTIAIVLGMTVPEVSGQAIANLGFQDIKLLAPVFSGDTIYAESEVLAKRPSKSRPGQGIVTVRTKGLRQDGVVFMTFERSALIRSRADAEANPTNY
ncbi:dehydratase [Litorivita pollutaquae]|uniref:Dehydratase n=1 Tax=Litorivita pollutaquae TaxID=2200892 RepID=A0A2V4MZI0_9RHOB|nr:MaoC family dehydratase [Litorivita pollutaquae]OUS22371.1 dehydratase [Rhodobacterales bacterium 59_46_T64]PYC47984.1 dehydratase [Litorivita pollutaquae]